MTLHMLTLAMHIATMTLVAPAAIVGIAMRVTRWKRYRRALRYVSRSEDGKLYVRDPQTGAMHQLYVGLDGKFKVQRGRLTRSEKKSLKVAKRKIREALA
jgi:hypothetical protein